MFCFCPTHYVGEATQIRFFSGSRRVDIRGFKVLRVLRGSVPAGIFLILRGVANYFPLEISVSASSVTPAVITLVHGKHANGRYQRRLHAIIKIILHQTEMRVNGTNDRSCRAFPVSDLTFGSRTWLLGLWRTRPASHRMAAWLCSHFSIICINLCIRRCARHRIPLLCFSHLF